jgi:hypothetical protein
MAERTLPEKLSGEEICKAIADRVELALRRHINPVHAFDYYTATISISGAKSDLGRREEFEIEVKNEAGVRPEDEYLDQFDEKFEVDPKPPNEERVETGQPVPVLTQDAEGHPDIKKVKYPRNKAKQV